MVSPFPTLLHSILPSTSMIEKHWHSFKTGLGIFAVETHSSDPSGYFSINNAESFRRKYAYILKADTIRMMIRALSRTSTSWNVLLNVSLYSFFLHIKPNLFT